MPWKPDYITVEQSRVFVRTDAADDADLATWCTAASRAIDTRCNRQFGNVDAPVTRTYRWPAVYNRRTRLWHVEIDDVRDGTGMTINGTALADTGAVLLPDNAPEDGRPYERLAFPHSLTMPIDVLTDRWGWAAFPAGVVGAAKLQVNRWAQRRESPDGVAGSPETTELRLLDRLDPDVHTTLAGLSRRRRVG